MTARLVAEQVLALAGNNAPRSPDLGALSVLAREYLRIASERASLGAVPHMFVTFTATRIFREALGIRSDEEARKQLTEILIDAKQDPAEPSRWRVRSRAQGRGLDVTALVGASGRLHVVTWVSVRPYTRGRK